MIKQIVKFIGSRAVGPIGLLVQLSLLARWMPNSDFNSFLEFYATTVVISAFADGGQRNQLFIALRHGHSHEEEQHAFDNAARIKVSISALMLIVAGVAWGFKGLAGLPTVLALLVGLITPVADIHLTVFRSKLLPNLETILVSCEQAFIVLLLIIFHRTGMISLITAAGSMIVAGVIRSTVSHVICSRRFGFTAHLVPAQGKWRTTFWENLSLVRVALPATIGIVCAQLFNRYPALTLRDHLLPRDYAVFIAFLSLFLRGQLVIMSVLQAGFRSNFKLWRNYLATAPGMIALGVVLASPVAIIVALFPHSIAVLYVGRRLADSYIYDVYAAALMLVCYPLCAVQQSLQLAGRNLVVATGAFAGLLVQFALTCAMSPQGAQSLIPYCGGILAYLGICTLELWLKVPRERL